MRNKVYDEAHVSINKIIGRRFNNPLGKEILKIFARFIRDRKNAQVLDVGCGRGESLLWLTRHSKARIVGIDPSLAMLAEAGKKFDQRPSRRLKIVHGTIERLPKKRSFDLIFSLDVLGWIPDKKSFLRSVGSRIKHDGLFALSGYFTDHPGSKYTKELCKEWAISPPGTFGSYEKLFEGADLEPLCMIDSTAKYRKHWTDVAHKLKRFHKKILDEVGEAAAEDFRRKAASITNATRHHKFGHIVILARPVHFNSTR